MAQVSYSDVGGLGDQIRQIREVRGWRGLKSCAGAGVL